MNNQLQGPLEEVNYSKLFAAFRNLLSFSIWKLLDNNFNSLSKILCIFTENKIEIFSRVFLPLRRFKNCFLIDEDTNYLQYFYKPLFGSMHSLVLLFLKVKIIHEWKHPVLKYKTPPSSTSGPAFRAKSENVYLCDLPKCAKKAFFLTLELHPGFFLNTHF